jgi:hypothetical protein
MAMHVKNKKEFKSKLERFSSGKDSLKFSKV